MYCKNNFKKSILCEFKTCKECLKISEKKTTKNKIKMENNIDFIKEMGGVLLVIINSNTYEVRRTHISSFLSIQEDKGDAPANLEQIKILNDLYFNSSCAEV